MFCCLCMLVLILMYRRLKSIMVSSPTFCCIQLLGILMGYLGCIMYVGKPNPAICIARQFIITTGFILVVGSLIAKSYRYVHRFTLHNDAMTSLLISTPLLEYTKCKDILSYAPSFYELLMDLSFFASIVSKTSSRFGHQDSNRNTCCRSLLYAGLLPMYLSLYGKQCILSRWKSSQWATLYHFAGFVYTLDLLEDGYKSL